MCVCVCVCLCVCASVRPSVCLSAKKFVNGYLTNKVTDLNENFGVCCSWPGIENLALLVQPD